ncbi:putative ribonuclease H-like domain-containing protein, partial [Tanacetum coccineum]
MVKQVELNKKKGKGTGQGENRPVWNNVQRLNHQNKFVPKAVLTKTGIFPVNTARQNLSSQAATTSTARKVNTAKSIVNEIRPRNNFYKSYSPIRRPFNRTTAPKANFSNQKVNTAEVKAVSDVGGKGKLLLSPQQVVIGEPKDITGTKSPNTIDNPQRALKNKGIVDSGCSKHMTGNKAYLVEYQDYNGGPVAFRGKQHKASCKAKSVSSISHSLQLLHMDLFGPTSVRRSNLRLIAGYTDDFSRSNQANKHAGPQEANQNAGTEDIIDATDSKKEDESAQDYFVLPIWSSYSSTIKRSIEKDAGDAPNKYPDLKTNGKPLDKEDQVFLDELERLKRQEKDVNDAAEALRKEFAQQTGDLLLQAGATKPSSTNIVNTSSTPVSTASPDSDLTNPDQDDSEIPALEEIYKTPTDGIFTNSSYDDEGAVADFTNLETVVNVSPIPTSRINSFHPSTLILGDPQSAVQTRSKVTKSSGAHAFISEALEDESWVDAMQEELLQFKIQKVWILMDLPYGKKAIGTKWVYRNKKDKRGVVVINKARLVAQGHRQEEGIDYDKCAKAFLTIGDEFQEVHWYRQCKVSTDKEKVSTNTPDGVNEEMENADAEVSTEDVLSTAQEKVSTDTPDGVNEEMENADAEVSTEDVLSTAQEKVSTDTPKVSTNRSKVSTDKEKVSTDTPKVSTDGSKVSTDKEKDSIERTDEGTDDQTKGRRATQTIQTTQT